MQYNYCAPFVALFVALFGGLFVALFVAPSVCTFFLKFWCISPWTFVSNYSNALYIKLHQFYVKWGTTKSLNVYRKSATTVKTDGRIVTDGPLYTGLDDDCCISWNVGRTEINFITLIKLYLHSANYDINTDLPVPLELASLKYNIVFTDRCFA